MSGNNKVGRTPIEGEIRRDFIPANRFTADDIFELEKNNLFPRIWHIAAREEEIPRVGDYVTYEIYDESIIMMRTAPDSIKAYYNVCPHRGRRLVKPGKGYSKGGFMCGFHGWKWDLDGQNTSVFHEDEWEGCPEFNKEAIALKQPKIDSFAGWLWLNMDADAEPLRDWLGPVADLLEPFQYDELRFAWHETLNAPVNWKTVIGAFQEGYHSGATHNSFVDYYSMRSPTQVIGNHAGFQVEFTEMPKMKRETGGWTAATSGMDMLYYQSKELHEQLSAQVSDPVMRALERLRKEFPEGSDETMLFPRFIELQKEEIELTGAKWPEKLTMEAMFAAGILIHIFPNTIVLPTVDAVLWYRMRPHPTDPNQCIFDIWNLGRFAPGEEPDVKQHISEGFEGARGRNPFLEQDFSNMEAVDIGVRSRGFVGARINPNEEGTTRHFYQMLDKYYGMPPLD